MGTFNISLFLLTDYRKFLRSGKCADTQELPITTKRCEQWAVSHSAIAELLVVFDGRLSVHCAFAAGRLLTSY